MERIVGISVNDCLACNVSRGLMSAIVRDSRRLFSALICRMSLSSYLGKETTHVKHRSSGPVQKHGSNRDVCLTYLSRCKFRLTRSDGARSRLEGGNGNCDEVVEVEAADAE